MASQRRSVFGQGREPAVTSIAYERGRFTVQDYPAIQRHSTPVNTSEAATPEHAVTPEPPAMPQQQQQAATSPMMVYAQPPQFLLRPVFMPTGSPVVVPGERQGGRDEEGSYYHNVGAGLDKIRTANVQHQKTLRDLIIFHRPTGDAVVPSPDVPAKLDRVGELVAALEHENQQLAADVEALRAECLARGLAIPETPSRAPVNDERYQHQQY